MPWYAAAAHPESTARYYLERAGIEIFRPVEHRYFVDPRTKHEKFRVRSIFAGYVFFKASDQDEMNRAAHVDGVSYVLGEWRGSQFVAKAMPAGWVDALVEAGPVIIGKRKQFVRYKKGDAVKSTIDSIVEFIGQVEKTSGHRVQVVSGDGRKINIPAELLEAI